MEYYAFLKLDAFYEEFMFFSNLCYKINSEASFYALSVCKTVYENTTATIVRVALTCDYVTPVFYMDDVLRYKFR